MPEIHDGKECWGGFVYVPTGPELLKRGADTELYANSRFMRPCVHCEVQKFARRLGGKLMTWENWVGVKDLKGAIDTFTSWVPGSENWAVLIHGVPPKPGAVGGRNGKTHVLSATGIAGIKQRRSVRYWNMGDLVENRQEPYFQTIADFKGLALFDDLGHEADVYGNRDAVDRLLNFRYRNHLPSIVTTKLEIGVLEKRYSRFMGRINAGLCIHWDAEPFGQTSEQPSSADNTTEAAPFLSGLEPDEKPDAEQASLRWGEGDLDS